MAERASLNRKQVLILLPYLKNGDGTAVALMNYYQALIKELDNNSLVQQLFHHHFLNMEVKSKLVFYLMMLFLPFPNSPHNINN